MELDEAELLCYLAAHANGEANGRDPLTCDRMGAALFKDLTAVFCKDLTVVFCKETGEFYSKILDTTIINLIAKAIVAKVYPNTKEAMQDGIMNKLYGLETQMYEGLIPTRSAKVLIMHTALLKRLGKLKEET